MRLLRALCCAVVLTACLAPGARADEFTKQTYLTFSGPVQLPGITLAAGTYMFKLADPEGDRCAIQVWDKDGKKLYTTLLTIPDQRMKVTDTPVVMFNERPSGEAQAIRSWFYPEESHGFEFIYPKQQATKIAKVNHASVLAFNGETRDPASFKSAKVGRVDESGSVSDRPSASASTTTARADITAPPATTARADTAPVGTSGTAQSDNTARRRELPRTAGSTTLIELMGALALAAAATVRSIRSRLTVSR